MTKKENKDCIKDNCDDENTINKRHKKFNKIYTNLTTAMKALMRARSIAKHDGG